MARWSISMLMAALIACFGATGGGVAHAHDLAESHAYEHGPLAGLHGHDPGHSHDHAGFDGDYPDGGSHSEDDGAGHPVFHVHGCAHAATICDLTSVPHATRAYRAAWRQATEHFNSLGLAPPRKPPRAFL